MSAVVYIQNAEEPVQVLSRRELRAARVQAQIDARQFRTDADGTETELELSDTDTEAEPSVESEEEEEEEEGPVQKRYKLTRQNAMALDNYYVNH